MKLVTLVVILALLGIAVYAAWQIWTTTLDMLGKVMWWALMVMSLIASCYMLYKWMKNQRKRSKRVKRTYRFLGKRKQSEMPPQVLYVCATNETVRAQTPKYQHQIHHILDVEEYDSKFVGDQIDEKTDLSCSSRIENPDILAVCGYLPESFDAVVFENCPILLDDNEEVHPSQRSVLHYPQTLQNVHELLKPQGVLVIPMAARATRESAAQRMVDRCEQHGFTLHDVIISNKVVGGWNMYVFKKHLESM